MGGKVALSVGIVPWECWDAAGYELLSRLTSRAGDHTFKKNFSDLMLIYGICHIHMTYTILIERILQFDLQGYIVISFCLEGSLNLLFCWCK